MSKKNNNDFWEDFIANAIVGIIVGIFGVGIALYLGFRIGLIRSATSMIIILAIGFFGGLGYGLWHAISGWKKNDNHFV